MESESIKAEQLQGGWSLYLVDLQGFLVNTIIQR